MPLNLRNDESNETFWVRDDELNVPNGDPETSYQLRHITREIARACRRKNVRTARSGMEQFDQVGFAEDLLDAVLVGWKGILLNGQPADCTRTNKLEIDGLRRSELIERAGLTEVVAAEERRGESFRGA